MSASLPETDIRTTTLGSTTVLILSGSILILSHKMKCTELGSFYLREGGYVIVFVCLYVCLSVSNLAQKLPNGFA